MAWAQRRKVVYISSVVTFVALVSFAIFYKVTSVPPTCFDNKKNGGETNVDCGGGCLQYCPNELKDPKLRWARSFEVTPGIVHAVASIEHSYPAAAAKEVRYVFKLYDEKNTLIVEKEGSTFLGPMGRTAIVETLIQTGNTTVADTRFSFIPPVPWERSDPVFSQIVIKTDRTLLETYEGGTRLTVTLENQSRYSFENSEIVALLNDASDNAITASKIIVPFIEAQGKHVVYFTWPEIIPKSSVRSIEVIPRFNIYTAKQL